MALTPTIRSSLGGGVVVSGVSTDLKTSGITAFAVMNYPTPFIKTSALNTQVLSSSPREQRVSQVTALVVALGRPRIRKARAWTFSLDGHDFYVLRVGEGPTLVYDLTTNEWPKWDSFERSNWRPHQGLNWLGAAKANYFGGLATNIIAGDDTFGTLWTLDPNRGYDDGPKATQEPQLFERTVTGGLPMRTRKTVRNDAVFLNINTGAPEFTNAFISLRTSDDNGNTWTDQGTIEVIPDQYDQEILWRSLGLVKAPGRIFEFTDYGATIRIDDATARIEGDS